MIIFGQESKFWSKIKILVKNRNSVKNKISSKIEILVNSEIKSKIKLKNAIFKPAIRVKKEILSKIETFFVKNQFLQVSGKISFKTVYLTSNTVHCLNKSDL